MKSKQRKSVPKTRGHKVEKKPHVPIRKHPISQQPCQRETADKEKYSENTQWEGNQDSAPSEGWQNEEKHTQIESIRNTENSEKPVHPGPIQTLPEMYKWCADDTETPETQIEAEELL